MESKFTGSLLGLIGINILSKLMIILTLGIALPWALVLKYKWTTKHTVIDGNRLYFDGTAIQLFGSWIKWFLLTIITLGIYGFWVSLKLKNWETSHTHVLGGTKYE